MRDKFNGSSQQKLEQIDKIADQINEAASVHNSIIATLKARTEMALKWLENQTPKIKDKYVSLCERFDAEDIGGVRHLLLGMDANTKAAVLSIPVLLPNGTKTDFLRWAEDVFARQDETGAFREILKTAAQAPLTPDFAHVKIPPAPVTVVTVQKPTPPGLLDKLTGEYEERVDRLQAEIELKKLERKLRQQAELEAVRSQHASAIKTPLKSLEQDLHTTVMAQRLFHVFEGDPEQKRSVLETALVFLKDNYGEEDSKSWLKAPVPFDDSGTSRLVRLLEMTAGNPETQTAMLDSALKFLSCDAARAEFLGEVAASLEGEQAEALQKIALGYSGDFIRTAELAIFRPEKAGFIAPVEGGLRMARYGHNDSVPADENTKKSILRYLKTQPGFVAFGFPENEITNMGMLSRSYYEKDSNPTILYTDFGAKSWNDKNVEPGTAVSVLDARAAQPGMVQLSDKTVIKKDAVDHAWITLNDAGNSYMIQYVIEGETRSISNISSPDRARELLDGFAQGYGRYMVTDTQMVDITRIGNMWIADKQEDWSCKLKFIIGDKNYNIPTTIEKAQAFIEESIRKYGHIRLTPEECLNPAQCAVIFHQPGESGKTGKLSYLIGGTLYSTTMGKDRAYAVLDEIGNGPGDFLNYRLKSQLNPAKVGAITYEKGRLNFNIGTESKWGIDMKADEAMRVLDKIAVHQDYIGLSAGAYISRLVTASVQYKNGNLYYGLNGKGLSEEKLSEEAAAKVIDRFERYGRETMIERILGMTPEAIGDIPVVTALFEQYGGAFEYVAPQVTPETEAPSAENDTVPEVPENEDSAPEKPRFSLDDFKDFNF
ncbi:MAG: hypothetical protein H6867_02225 [Rhodospirillales bacterium]|nr:hypothetical protein [Rhodospirillales bacterium]MCB9997004.1 hypothetical protein [Rhodospirillales bacterium]